MDSLGCGADTAGDQEEMTTHEQYADYWTIMTVHTDSYNEVEMRFEGKEEIKLMRKQVRVLVRQLEEWLERTKI